MQSLNDIEFHKLVALEANESLYVKPLRLHYTQKGKSLSWDCIQVHDSVSVIIYNTTRKALVFVRQFRPAVYLSNCYNISHENDLSNLQPLYQIKSDKNSTGFTLELCAGIIDKHGKSPLEIAREEVLEETGYDVSLNALKFVSSYRSGVGVSGSLQHLYFCEVNDEIRVNKGGGVDDEQIEVIELSVDECRDLLWRSEDETSFARPASMLLAISWFLYQHLPTIDNK